MPQPKAAYLRNHAQQRRGPIATIGLRPVLGYGLSMFGRDWDWLSVGVSGSLR